MTMFRIRRKLALLLGGSFVVLVLFIYLLINNSVPTAKQPNNIHNIESKLKELEKSLSEHHKDIGEIRKQIATVKTNSKQIEEENILSNDIFKEDEKDAKEHLKHSKLPLPKRMNKDNENDDNVAVEETESDTTSNRVCPVMTEVTPTPDIQMLQLYKEIPFDNPDGGAWKQGWAITYDDMEFNKHHKLKVFVVPHSHNDPGWIKTLDQYYEYDTKNILSNMLRHLNDNPGMTFIWAEIVYFSRWFETLSKSSRDKVKKLIKRRQLEFVTGGWVMPDEANSHWLSIMIQLTEGQTWLKKHLNVTPTSSWSIDPFGQSSTMPYLLKQSGIDNLLIQRVHYSVKKRLAQKRELEFRWRQIWDGTGETDLFTHMMPFYSYDVPHTCGPDPKVCCQFDFKRLPGFGLTCPWKIPPRKIDDMNVAKRAEMIVDQWRKKSVLYRTRSVLIPLGDDFRYSQSTEWEAQTKNYEKLFEYINNEPSLFTEAKFGTLQEYFDSVRREKQISKFPSLSGDFFTYADRDDHYWSGYYTSRPYHKRMDRVLLHYIRSAEMLLSWHKWDLNSDFYNLIENARQQLSLFQHHDAIAGTAQNVVVQDYANRMLEAIKSCRLIMQQAAYRLLTKPSIYSPDYKFVYFYLDDSRWPGPDDGRTTIIVGNELPTKYVVFYNSLPYEREELMDFFVSKPFIKVSDFNNIPIEAEVSPVWSWHRSYSSMTAPQPSTTKYRLSFLVKVPPLGLSTYIVHSTNTEDHNSHTSYAKITIFTEEPFSINMGDYPLQPKFAKPREVSIQQGKGPIAAFSKMGLLKSIQKYEYYSHVPVHLSFSKYGVRKKGSHSGAYLFLPDGPSVPLMLGGPTVLMSEGRLESSVTTGLPFANHQTILRNGQMEIRNLIDIGNMDNTEIVMKFSTNIRSKDVFYTDLNGFQMIKRERFKKLPLQANYYPIPASIFIEDDQVRLTILTAQPLGGSSLESGEIEIMQDRRLTYDDERGLGQGVLDNQPVLHIFRVELEYIKECEKLNPDYTAGFLTHAAHSSLQSLLHPIDKMIGNENSWPGALGSFGENHKGIKPEYEIGLLQSLPMYSGKSDKMSLGVLLYRMKLHSCTSTEGDENENMVNLRDLLSLNESTKIYSSPLTFLKKEHLSTKEDFKFCPMDVKGFIIQR